MRFNPTARRAYLVPALGLVLVTAMSACSSSSSSSSSAPGSSASATASASSATPAVTPPSASASGGSSASAVSEIKTNWTTFFNPSTPNSKRVQLLENGSQFSSAIASFSSSPMASAVSSKVNSVTLTSSTKATVKYDLSAAGQTVASNQNGTAVLQNGTWKVGDDVFCGLLTEAKSVGVITAVPAACSSAS